MNKDDFIFISGGNYDDDFYIGKKPITNYEYCHFLNDSNDIYYDPFQDIIKENGYASKNGKGDFPVTNVSFFAAKNYAKWKSKVEKNNFRLPTTDEYKRSGLSRNFNVWEWTKDKWENSAEFRIIIFLGSQEASTNTDYRILSHMDSTTGFRLIVDCYDLLK